MSNHPEMHRVIKRRNGQIVAVLTAQRVEIDDGLADQHPTVKYVAFYEMHGNVANLGSAIQENNQPKYFSKVDDAIAAAWEKARLNMMPGIM